MEDFRINQEDKYQAFKKWYTISEKYYHDAILFAINAEMDTESLRIKREWYSDQLEKMNHFEHDCSIHDWEHWQLWFRKQRGDTFDE